MYGSLDVSTSGMVAQRKWLNVIASNLANANTTFDAQGNYAPYRRRIARFAAIEGAQGAARGSTGRGVQLAEIGLDQGAFKEAWRPDSPHAVGGYVKLPNIDPVSEQMDAMQAVRAYEANVMVAESTKSMLAQGLRMIA